jgi:site-specific recombinase XerD
MKKLKDNLQLLLKKRNISMGEFYKGTHILRHGGFSYLFNKTHDLTVAKQHLGNKSMDATMIYAHRDKQALKTVAIDQWKTASLAPNGRN